MKLRDVPSMRFLAEEVGALIPILNDAFEAGADYGRECNDNLRLQFGDPAFPLDPWHFPHSVRLSARRYLSQKGLEVEDYKLDELAMSGLRFIYKGWDIRVRKASRQGGLPNLGNSKTIQAFCQQMLPGDFGKFSGRNLMILWHVTSDGKYQGLTLMYLLGGADTPKPEILGQLYFPAAANISQSNPQWQEDVNALGDLPMELDTEGEEDEGTRSEKSE